MTSSSSRLDDHETRITALEARRRRKFRSSSWLDGADLRRARLAADLTLSHLAMMLDVSASTLCGWETGAGRVARKRAEQVRAVFARLDVKPPRLTKPEGA